jgi:hypothetical protein
MRHEKMRLDDAYALLLAARPAIFPNKAFFDQLLAYDSELYPGERPLDMEKMHRDKPPI